MKRVPMFLVVLCFLGFVAATHAGAKADSPDETLEQYFEMLKFDLRDRRNANLRGILQLGPQQAGTFATLQNAYDEELAKIGSTRKEMLLEFSKVHARLTPPLAGSLAGRFFDLEFDRILLHRKYFDLISNQVSAVIAVQFLQVQIQFETLGDLKVAARVPIAADGEVDSADQSKILESYLETMKKKLNPARDRALREFVELGDYKRKELAGFTKSYDKEFAKASNERRTLLLEYSKVHKELSPVKAAELADRVFSLDETRLVLHRTYFRLISENISPVVAVQFLQIQSRFETMADVRASTYVPIAGM